MDRFNEQLVAKKADGKDKLIRILIIAAAAIFTAVSVIATVIFAMPMLILIGGGVCYLAWWMYGNTYLEYEYIITNNDLDIDKIIGKRKRKRLISIKLSTVTEFGQYKDGRTGEGADATVVAADGTQENTWYIVCSHANYGKLLVLFSPEEDTVECINQGLSYSVRVRLPKKEEKTEE